LIDHDQDADLGVLLGQHVAVDDELELLLGVGHDPAIVVPLGGVDEENVGLCQVGDVVEPAEDGRVDGGVLVLDDHGPVHGHGGTLLQNQRRRQRTQDHTM
jgi:hypothetical protein